MSILAVGSRRVAESRLRNMWRWRNAIITFGIGNPVLYLIAVGLGVGSLVEESMPGGIDGIPYLAFIAPALIITAAMQAGQDEVVFPTLAGFIWTKTFYAMRATSLTGAQIAEGVLFAAFGRIVLTSVVYGLVLLLFGAVSISGALGVTALAILTGTCWAATMQAIAASVHDDGGFLSLAGRVIIMPMFLFSGTFYPLSALPLAVQWIGWISPLWHATELGRWLSYGAPTPLWQVCVSVAYLMVLGVGGVVLARRRFERRLTS
ncbi:MAG: ABC transporter permease [Candidatus Nanopelagicales bacterium]|nr:ABC transporter permease [Candidatus Nanopelagicales bacterium]MCF8536285.1 ABC transporter permease [Candidatus Nanopelagicales bacterium]MCF8541440.1 ABC transporter permease [Candidatus Nanopelagicales bacterium]MCF8556088.1 ABC transporter permease [Candidatus Nanopelagicales bacterium]